MPIPERAPRALIVDDEDSILRFAQRVLEEGGYDVAVAADGPAALRQIEQQPHFDIFVVDVMMPLMRGDELARQLRHADPDAKVLYFTGHSDRLFTEKPVLWENEAFVEKPLNAAGLLEAVSLLLFGHTRGPRAGG